MQWYREAGDFALARRIKHNQVEIRRRERINQRFDELKDLIDCSDTNKGTILLQAIDCIRDLEAELEEITGKSSASQHAKSRGKTGAGGGEGHSEDENEDEENQSASDGMEDIAAAVPAPALTHTSNNKPPAKKRSLLNDKSSYVDAAAVLVSLPKLMSHV